MKDGNESNLEADVSVGLPRCPRSNEQVVLRHLDGETVAYHLLSDELLLLNSSAASILEMCDGVRTIEEIVSTLSEAYSVPLQTAREGVLRTLVMMRAHGFLDADGTS